MENILDKLIDQQYYWVRHFKRDAWEIAKYHADTMEFKYTNGCRQKAKETAEIGLKQIERPQS